MSVHSRPSSSSSSNYKASHAKAPPTEPKAMRANNNHCHSQVRKSKPSAGSITSRAVLDSDIFREWVPPGLKIRKTTTRPMQSTKGSMSNKPKPPPGSLSFFFPDAVPPSHLNQPVASDATTSQAGTPHTTSSATSHSSLESPTFNPSIPSRQISNILPPIEDTIPTSQLISSSSSSCSASIVQILNATHLAESEDTPLLPPIPPAHTYTHTHTHTSNTSNTTETTVTSLTKQFFDLQTQIEVLDKRYLDTKRDLIQLQCRSIAFHDDSKDQGSSTSTVQSRAYPNHPPSTLSTESDSCDSLLILTELLVEAERILVSERSERERIECILDDVRRECEEPKIVPELLRVFRCVEKDVQV